MRRKHEINSISNRTSVIFHLIAILGSLMCVLPFILVIAISVTDETAIMQEGYEFFPSKFSLDGYRYIFKNGELLYSAYMNTILSTVTGTVLNTLMIALYAYPLSRPDFPYKKFFNTFILILMLFNGGFVASYLINVRVLMLKNTFWALVLPSLGGGFYVFVTRTFFQTSIPYEIIESAKIDGCNEHGIFWKLVLPLALPVLAVNGLINIYGFWNNWMNSLYYITDSKYYTLQYVMQQALRDMELMKSLASSGSAEAQNMSTTLPAEAARMAMVIVGIGPIIVVYPFLQKYFVKGLTVGAIKG